MGADMMISAVPLHLTHAAGMAWADVEGVALDTACVAVWRARLDEPDSLAGLDLETTIAIDTWLDTCDLAATDPAATTALRARIHEALDAIAAAPRDLTRFYDPVGDRCWLTSGGLSSGDVPTDICYELDLVAETGLWRRAITPAELTDALDQLHHPQPTAEASTVASDADPWRPADAGVAATEGWGLFDTGREPVVEIQCIDTPDMGEPALDGDEAAWDALLDGIVRGSPTHGRAFAIVVANAPSHAAELVAHWANTAAHNGF
jgi:hypothetical protein